MIEYHCSPFVTQLLEEIQIAQDNGQLRSFIRNTQTAVHIFHNDDSLRDKKYGLIYRMKKKVAGNKTITDKEKIIFAKMVERAVRKNLS